MTVDRTANQSQSTAEGHSLHDGVSLSTDELSTVTEGTGVRDATGDGKISLCVEVVH